MGTGVVDPVPEQAAGRGLQNIITNGRVVFVRAGFADRSKTASWTSSCNAKHGRARLFLDWVPTFSTEAGRAFGLSAAASIAASSDSPRRENRLRNRSRAFASRPSDRLSFGEILHRFPGSVASLRHHVKIGLSVERILPYRRQRVVVDQHAGSPDEEAAVPGDVEIVQRLRRSGLD
jgi:hypothetical protein